MRRAFLSAAALSLFACQGAIPVKNTGAYEKPRCRGEGPGAGELERQREELFRIIESSGKYRSARARSAAIRQYKRQIEAKERSSCPEETELFMEQIARLHDS